MLTLFLSVILLATTAAPPAVAAQEPQAGERSARVRAADKRTAVLLTRGLERSATIRALVAQLEQSDVIVYIEMNPGLRKRLAGKLTWITSTKAHRYVRVSINPELHSEMAIATLGHELQHALEVANAPTIVSTNTLERYYSEHGDASPTEVSGWDTEAARLAGNEVRRELALSRPGRATDAIQQF
jgi:hypothetical protein